MAKLLSINLSEKKGVIKKPVSEAVLIEEYGIEGDAHAGKWHRQVSLLGQESVDKMIAKGLDHLKPGDFAENLLTEGIVLYELPVGTILTIGETKHEVTQIGKECHTGCEIKQITGECVMPKEGIFTRVLKGGTIRIGDEITVIEYGEKDVFTVEK
ncbi:MOSC domain-containing protein [Acidaminobacter sp. JC074]|uniref:MOSC domain-containing protein n=1 Tax=Acidaminobacter sp. JC074 TaxID=2530199 RepID=UPI001F10E029|nr:MOSC domain-containing protein [Acidaminobacter sp. JC074]MCH4888988.1 MOSC domain-containing protein [Acidaminobacter sp. JC074]